MFCLIYFPFIGDVKQPNVLEISQSKPNLQQKMEEKAIQQCIDEVGRKNFVNTLDQKDNLKSVSYPIYPTLAPLKTSETTIEVYKIEKKQIIVKGYLYNSTQEVVESSLMGTYYVVQVENWKYEELPQRPQEEKQIIIRPLENKPMIRNYDNVLLQLIESIQKRKLE